MTLIYKGVEPPVEEGHYIVRVDNELTVAEFFGGDDWNQLGIDYDVWQYSGLDYTITEYKKIDLNQLIRVSENDQTN